MQAAEIVVTELGPEHLDAAHVLSRQAAWPHRREDWAMMRGLSRGTVALEGGRVVGTALTTPFGEDAATINMVIVDEALRGRGLGRRLMQAALAAAGERECRLVATQEGLPLYEKLGFRATGRIAQHQGIAPVLPAPEDVDIAWSAAPRAEKLAEMDRAACGMDRSGLIRLLIAQARVAELRRGRAVEGFAVLRPFGRGEVVGPVVARSLTDAQALLGFVVAARPGAFLRVDTPETSGLVPWLAERGLAPVGGGVTMRRNARSEADGSFHTFTLASQALG